MKLTKKTDYALRVLQDLATLEKGQVLPAKEMAKSNELSLKFLQSVLSDLAKEGLVKSTPGPKGGFFLNQPASEITVYRVVEVLEGPVHLMDCMAEATQCGEFSSCSIHGLFGRAQLAVMEILSSKSIADLLPCRSTSRG